MTVGKLRKLLEGVPDGIEIGVLDRDKCFTEAGDCDWGYWKRKKERRFGGPLVNRFFQIPAIQLIYR